MKFILLGAPGAGKGTQAEILAKKLGIPQVATGSILREAIKKETEVGLVAKSYVESGQLVPDDVVIGIVKERIKETDCQNGYILDGMPRNIAQAQALDDAGIDLNAAISFEIDDAIIEKRMTGRRTCTGCACAYHVVANPPKVDGICDSCGSELEIRSDDSPETVKARLKVYHDETEPLLDYYGDKGKVRRINGDQSIEGATRDILEALGVLDK